MKWICICAGVLIVASCRFQGNSDGKYADYKDQVYHLRLDPAPGTNYHYDIDTEVETTIEVDGKESVTKTKTSTGVNYFVTKDSLDNIVFKVSYDKLRVLTKNGDTEMEMDAANASFSINPVERLLGIIKDAEMEAKISPDGTILQLTGYQELGDRLVGSLDPSDIYGRKVAREQWENFLGERFVKSSFEKLFRIFPDSTVHVGSTWRLDTKEKGELDFAVKNLFELKSVNPSLSIIESKGRIASEKQQVKFNGYGVSADLEGSQNSQYDLETQTGMLLNGKTNTNVKGSLEVSGKKVPVQIKSLVQIKGRKM